jgi:hypothetical protein
MRRKWTESQRAQTSVTEPRSCVSAGSSQRAAFGFRSGSRVRRANSAAAQTASRDQTKISMAERAERHGGNASPAAGRCSSR